MGWLIGSPSHVIYQSLLDIENSHSGISPHIDWQAKGWKATKPIEVVSKCQTDHLREHQRNVCIESLQGLGIPWHKPQNSIKPGEPAQKNLSQISDIPISEAVRLFHETPPTHPAQTRTHPVLWCINRSSKEKRRVTQNCDSNHRVRCECVRPGGVFFFSSFFSHHIAGRDPLTRPPGWYWRG